MELAEAQIVVQFAAGVETKQDRKGVLPGKLLALENSVFTKAISLVKRNGYADLGGKVLGSSKALPKGRALGARDSELLCFTEDEVYSYVTGAGAWAKAADLRSVIVGQRAVAKTGTNQTVAECAIADGIALYAWEDSAGGVWYSLLDDTSGRTLVPATQLDAGGERPRVIALGQWLHLVVANAATRELVNYRFDTASPTTSPTAIVLTSDLSGTVPVWDMDRASDAVGQPAAVLVWATPYGTVTAAYLHESGIIGSAAVSLPPSKIHAMAPGACLAVAAVKEAISAGLVVVAWNEGGAVKYKVLDDLLDEWIAPRTLATEAAAPVQLTVAFDGQNLDVNNGEDPTLWVFYQLGAGAPQDHLVKAVRTDCNAGALTILATRTQRGAGLGSKAFRYGEDAYVHLLRDSALFRTYFCQRAEGGLVVARFLPGLAGGLVGKPHLPSVRAHEDDADLYYFPAIYVMDLESRDGDVFTEKGLRRISLDFDAPSAFRSVQIGRTLYIAGGFLQAYDGARVVEAGFHYGLDDLPAPTLGVPTGTGIAPGVRNYVVVPEAILANGEVERGPVSAPVTVTIAPGDNRRVIVTSPTYRLTAKQHVRLGVYRTEDGDPSSYYRVTSLDPATAGQVNGYLANDAGVDSVTFVDEMSDDDLLEQDPLYTNGGIIPARPLGGADLVAAGKGRLFVVDGDRIYYSHERAEGHAVELSPALQIVPDQYGGDPTGIVVLDDKLVVFKATAIYMVAGPGPAPNPELGGGFVAPQLVTSDVGCISADSIGYTPVGVLFQSQKGIWQLGRDMATDYVGRAVEKYNGQTVVATNRIDDRTQIRFLTSSGRTLLYDYEHRSPDGAGQWSTFTNHEGQDAVVVGGLYHYLRNDGQVWRETPGLFKDNNSQIRRAEETAWLKLAGHSQGWQMLWTVTVLGEHKSPHKLRVYTAFDYEEGWSGKPIEIDTSEGRVEAVYGAGPYGAGPYGGAPDTRYQFEIHIGQECEAVRFRFEDVEATGDAGASYELSELILIGGVQRSTFQIEHARSW